MPTLACLCPHDIELIMEYYHSLSIMLSHRQKDLKVSYHKVRYAVEWTVRTRAHLLRSARTLNSTGNQEVGQISHEENSSFQACPQMCTTLGSVFKDFYFEGLVYNMVEKSNREEN